MKIEIDGASHWLRLIHQFLEEFGWLGDSFVLDFYNECHWEKLPSSWRHFLPKLNSLSLAKFLDFHDGGDYHFEGKEVAPLSLLAFRKAVQVLSFRRNVSWDNALHEIGVTCRDHSDDLLMNEFKNLFTRHVKLKKRHEVENMGELVTILGEKTEASNVYDIGSGLGHLSRYLSYACKFQLMCVDREQNFGESATKFDKELSSFLQKKEKYIDLPKPPIHVCVNLELNKHEQIFQSQPFLFGFTGLHACGNLTPVIIHNFVNSPAKFLVSLGCCYMKLDGNGFPLSKISKDLGLKLNYESLEVSCHALEQYCDRLRLGQIEKLKTHSYRAALETILVKQGFKRAGLRSVPHTEKLSFEEYSNLAIRNLQNVNIQSSELSSPEIKEHLNNWFKVVLFYSLRLMIANVIETSILLDRGIFIKEADSSINTHIIPLFNPKISARNMAIVCWRNKNNSLLNNS